MWSKWAELIVDDKLLIKSNINDWLDCAMSTGKIHSFTSGAISCSNIQEVSTECTGEVYLPELLTAANEPVSSLFRCRILSLGLSGDQHSAKLTNQDTSTIGKPLMRTISLCMIRVAPLNQSTRLESITLIWKFYNMTLRMG